jgi:hypothetical protein
MVDDPRKRGTPDRSKISMGEDHEVRYWTKHLGITRADLQAAVDKGRKLGCGGAQGAREAISGAR